MDQKFEPRQYLEGLSDIPDEDINLAQAALALSALDHPGISVDRYFHHLQLLAEDVANLHHEQLKKDAEDTADLRLRSLRQVLVEQHEYLGDVHSYDDLQNASLIRVIDRAKGLPITLSILYIHAARMQGWNVDGLNIPGHFVCRLEYEGDRLIFDPFHGGELLEASDLRDLVKRALGPQAELTSAYYEPTPNREILFRLENNIKHRKIDAEDYEGALEHVKRMRLIDPEEYRLMLDAGVLYAKTDQPKAAIEMLANYIDRAPNNRDRHEAELLLQELTQSLH